MFPSSSTVYKNLWVGSSGSCPSARNRRGALAAFPPSCTSARALALLRSTPLKVNFLLKLGSSLQETRNSMAIIPMPSAERIFCAIINEYLVPALAPLPGLVSALFPYHKKSMDSRLLILVLSGFHSHRLQYMQKVHTLQREHSRYFGSLLLFVEE